MKTVPLVCLMGLWLTTGLTADPLYQVSFTGVITEGRASGYNPSISNNSQTFISDLTGVRVSGSLIFDLGVAPAPIVNVDANGFISTQIQTDGLPVYVTEYFSVDGFTVPPGFFPMPTVFDLQPAAVTIPGSVVTTQSSHQSLGWESNSVPSVQSVTGEINFADFWSGPRFVGGHITKVNFLASSIAPFFAIPTAGSFPVFGASNIGGSGNFQFANLSSDATIPSNFGITQWYDVTGKFSIDSASGAFLVPEPGSFGLGLSALTLVSAVLRRRLFGASA